MNILSQLTYKDYNMPDVRHLERNYFIPAPEEINAGNDKEEALQLIKDALGFANGIDEIVIQSPIEKIKILPNLLKHMVEKRTDARERYANFIFPTLRSPFEIYRTEYEDGFRNQYIGLFEGKINLLCVVKLDGFGNVLLWNIMQTDKRIINKHRVGDLIWSKIINALPSVTEEQISRGVSPIVRTGLT